MTERTGQRLFTRIIIVTILVMLAGMAVLGLRSMALLNDKVGPELRANAHVIADRVRSQIETALALGIPLEALVGVDPYLRAALDSGPGVARLALISPDGQILHAVAAQAGPTGGVGSAPWILAGLDAFGGTTSDVADTLVLPVTSGGVQVATLSVDIDPLFVARQLQDISLDIMVLAGVAILLAVEVLLLILSRSVRSPLGQFSRMAERLNAGDYTARATPIGPRCNVELIEAANALAGRVNKAAAALSHKIDTLRIRMGAASEARLVQAERALAAAGRFAQTSPERLATTHLIGVRGAAFLFVLAEELTRPFMPLFVQNVTQDPGRADQAMLIAIPISAFMAGAALAGPVAAVYSDRVGRRRSFMLGAVLSTAGLIWTAFAPDFVDLLLSRALSGLGYALTFVACQGHVIDKTDTRTRTMGMSVFVGGIMAADICGPAIGGILADQIGYTHTLLVAAGTAGFAAVLALVLLDDSRRYASTPARGLGLGAVGPCLRNPRFACILVLTAIPAKMILTGFLFFLVPLMMVDLGTTKADIGRVAMIYGLSAIVLMPLFALVTDRFKAHGAMVGLGALITGWALVPLAFEPGVLLIACAVTGLGIGQAMSIPAQTVLVTLVSEPQIARYGPGPVLAVFRLAERLGAVAGPLIAAQAVQVAGLAKAGALFGFVAVVTGTIFSALFLTIGTHPSPPQKDQI